MNQNPTISEYIEGTRSSLESEPEAILADLYLADFYHKIEEGSVNLRTSEGKKLCQEVVDYFINSGNQERVDDFCQCVARITQNSLDFVVEKAVAGIGTIALVVGFCGSLAKTFRDDVGAYFEKRRTDNLREYLGIA